MSGKVPPSLTAKCSLKQPRHSSKLNIPIPRSDLFMSILVYSGSVLWNSLPVCIRRPPGTEMFQITLHVIHYALTGWQCMLNLVIVTRLQGYTYNTVSPVLHAFTHQIMFATNDFKAPCLQTPMTTWVSSIWVLSVGLQTPMTTWVSSSWVLSVGLQTPRPTWVLFSWVLSVGLQTPRPTWVSFSWVLSVGLRTPIPTWVSFIWVLSVGLQTPRPTWVSFSWVLSVGLQTPTPTWVSFIWVLSVGLQTPRPTWVSFSWVLSVGLQTPIPTWVSSILVVSALRSTCPLESGSGRVMTNCLLNTRFFSEVHAVFSGVWVSRPPPSTPGGNSQLFLMWAQSVPHTRWQWTVILNVIFKPSLIPPGGIGQLFLM